jgi:hypothetical protein
MAGMLLNCNNKTEIAVHDADMRVVSLMAYDSNKITIGRDMGWGAIGDVEIKGDVTTTGLVQYSSFALDTEKFTITDQTNYRRIQSYGSKPLVLNSVGNNVGIGTTNPEEKLHVSGNIKVTNNIYCKNHIIRSHNPTLWLRDSNNRSSMFHVNSNIFYILRGSDIDSLTWSTYNGYWPLELNLEDNFAKLGGDVVVKGEVRVKEDITAYFSDIRLKTIISEIKDPLNKVQSLNGFYYKPNELAHKMGINSSDVEIGLSAQDVQSVLPELVKLAPIDSEENEDGVNVSRSGNNYLTVCYERMIPILVESIKELNKQNEISITKLIELEKTINGI